MSKKIIFPIVAILVVGGVIFWQTKRQSGSVNPLGVNESRELPQGIVAKVFSPNGGETFPVNVTIPVSYAVSPEVIASITPNDRVELYLLNDQNVLIRLIGMVNPADGKFVVDPKKLYANAGLDSIITPIETGQYKILFVVRPRAKVYFEGDYPVDELDSFLKFEDGVLRYIIPNATTQTLPFIAADASDDFFTIMSDYIPPKDKG